MKLNITYMHKITVETPMRFFYRVDLLQQMKASAPEHLPLQMKAVYLSYLPLHYFADPNSVVAVAGKHRQLQDNLRGVRNRPVSVPWTRSG